jgi:hypothetical protein
VTYPVLGRLTTSIAGGTDMAIVERSWGLCQSLPPGAPGALDYGSRFTVLEFARASTVLNGLDKHFRVMLFYLVMAVKPLRRFVTRYTYQPGEGRTAEEAANEEVEMRGIADPDVKGEVTQRAFARTWFKGSAYYGESKLLLLCA